MAAISRTGIRSRISNGPRRKKEEEGGGGGGERRSVALHLNGISVDGEKEREREIEDWKTSLCLRLRCFSPPSTLDGTCLSFP